MKYPYKKYLRNVFSLKDILYLILICLFIRNVICNAISYNVRRINYNRAPR